MSQVLLYTSYGNPQPYGDHTGQVFGTMYDVTEWTFETGAEAVTTTFVGTYDDFQDSNHPEPFRFDGEFYAYCAGTTRRGFVHDGAGGFTVEEEADSLSCGWVPPVPLTCELATASVSQVPTPTGATLTAALTGTAHGRVQYRLDAGPEQASPIFYNVLAGPHVLVLRDDGLAGCTRTVPVQVAAPAPPAAPAGAPQGVDLVGQPLWYRPAPAPANADVQLELWAESAHNQEDFSLVFTLRKRTSQLGTLHFRLDTLLWPLLRAWVPQPGAGSSLCTSNLLNYFVRTSTLAPGQPPVYVTGPLRTALRGGLPAEWSELPYEAFRQAHFAPRLPFLSWQPYGAGTYAAGQAKRVTAQQPEWLFFLCPAGLPAEPLQVRRAYGTSHINRVVAYEPLALPARGWAGQLLAIPLRPSRTDYPRLSLRLETLAGVPLSVSARYRLVEATARTRYLLFTNSLGGVDTLRCEGKLDVTLEATTEKAERPARYGDAAATADRQVLEVTAGRKLRLASGWLEPAELAWLPELVLSREAWQQVGPQLRPLDVSKRSLTPYADEPGLRGLLLEFDYAYAPTAYAPTPYA